MPLFQYILTISVDIIAFRGIIDNHQEVTPQRSHIHNSSFYQNVYQLLVNWPSNKG